MRNGIGKGGALDVARSYTIVSHYSGRLDRLNGSFIEIEPNSGLTAKIYIRRVGSTTLLPARKEKFKIEVCWPS